MDNKVAETVYVMEKLNKQTKKTVCNENSGVYTYLSSLLLKQLRRPHR